MDETHESGRNGSACGAQDVDKWTEVASVVILGIATVASAWSGFQSSLWSGVQSFLLADAAKYRTIASEKATLAGQQRNLDAGVFLEYERLMIEGRAEFAHFVYNRMRPELHAAIDKWQAMKPMHNAAAPTSPFVMPEYQIQSEKESADLQRDAEKAEQKATQANLNGDRYTMLTVVYAAVLFLAGMVSSFKFKKIRRIVLSFSLVLLMIASAVMFTIPVAHPR